MPNNPLEEFVTERLNVVEISSRSLSSTMAIPDICFSGCSTPKIDLLNQLNNCLRNHN